MVRGKVEVRKIENKLKRQMSFYKRKNNLLKKASELSVLCDADVAVVVFSSCGKLHEFSNAGVSETLERYQRYHFISQENAVKCVRPFSKSWCKEMSELQANYESFQRTDQRHLLGEDLGPLGVKELQDLEKQLEEALAKTREKMTQLMMEQLEEQRMKVLHLDCMNNQLKSQVDDKSFLMALPCSYGNDNASHALSTLECDTCTKPVQQMGYLYDHGEGSSVPKTESTGLQGWLI